MMSNMKNDESLMEVKSNIPDTCLISWLQGSEVPSFQFSKGHSIPRGFGGMLVSELVLGDRIRIGRYQGESCA
jgi:hypothetical protein